MELGSLHFTPLYLHAHESPLALPLGKARRCRRLRSTGGSHSASSPPITCAACCGAAACRLRVAAVRRVTAPRTQTSSDLPTTSCFRSARRCSPPLTPSDARAEPQAHACPTLPGARLPRRRSSRGGRLLCPRRSVGRVQGQGQLRGGATRAGPLLAVLPPGQEVGARAGGAARGGGRAARPLGQHRLLLCATPAL